MRTCIILIGLSLTASQAQNLLTNGSFESPVFADPSINSSPSVPDWGGIPFIFAGDNGSNWPNGAAEGNQFASAGSGPSTVVGQSFVVSSAEILGTITWRATTSEALVSGTYKVDFRDKATGVILESSTYTVTGGVAGADVWDRYSLPLNGGPYGDGVYQIEFSAVSTSSLDFFIDDVQANAVPTAISTISPTAKHAWAANAGWVNFRPTEADGVVTSEAFLSGRAYAANLGWITLGDGSPANGYAYANTTGTDSGINMLPGGDLSGLAWSANAGWIKFDTATGSRRARIDLLTGEFKGYAYGANIGWLKLDGGGLSTDSLHCEDTDGDDLPDAWERQHFGSLSAAAGEDPDNDGATNAEEYAALTLPDDSSDSPPTATIDIFESPFPAIPDYRVLLLYARPGRIYQLEFSTDLETWAPFGPSASPTVAGERSFIGDSLEETDPRKFFKVVISKPLQ